MSYVPSEMFCSPLQGADGVRGLKGNKGEKVRDLQAVARGEKINK